MRFESNRPSERLADSLTCEPLHLDIEELPEVAEPFNHLGGHTAVKLDSGEQNDSRRGFLNDAVKLNMTGDRLLIAYFHTVVLHTYLDIREVGLESVGAGVAGVEEHELGFLQMAGRQSLLGVHMSPVKAFLPHWSVKAGNVKVTFV